MKVKVLASGSKGNSTLVVAQGTSIIIDVGITANQIKKALENDEVKLDEITGILISHTHSDHIKGLAQIVKKYKIKVYAPIDLATDLVKYITADDIIVITKSFNINSIKVELLETSHDVCSYGFVIEEGNSSLVYITDTGYINKKHYPKTSNKTIYIIEANHDEEMLMNGSYPYFLKQRVISDKGHMSNSYTGNYLKKVIGKDTKYILLAHISEKNNTPDLALHQVKDELKETNFDLDNVMLTDQYKESDLIEV